MIKYIDGDLIKLALNGEFDVITHGVNCFCKMGSGIAPQMAKAFGCDTFDLEAKWLIGDINKLGQIDYQQRFLYENKAFREVDSTMINFKTITVVNSYTQYYYGRNNSNWPNKPVDYEAITLCMRKMKNKFKGSKFGFPKIGSGLAGGDWDIISEIIERELINEDITVINYVP